LGYCMKLHHDWRFFKPFIGLLMLASSGCDLDRVAVDTTAGIMAKAEGVARSYFDWESAGYASPAGIIQLEGLHVVSPDNDRLCLTLVKAYMAYAYGWVMDSYELAERAGDFELAEHHKQRAFLMYSRARDLAMRVVNHRKRGATDHFTTSDTKALASYLAQNFDEDDMPSLFWLMMSWSSAINNSTHMEDLSDMATLRVIAQWVVDKKPEYEDAGALVFLGGFEASMPKAFGGNPEKGKAYFERALKLTGRKNQILLINYAATYAVAAQDRKLYVALMREIIEAPDLGPAVRMSNKVARRRATRMLTRVDELFFENL
jgi:hypothetical protein